MIIDSKTYMKIHGAGKLHGFECEWCHLPFFSTRKETKYCCKSHSVMASMARRKKTTNTENKELEIRGLEVLLKTTSSETEKVSLKKEIQNLRKK